MRTDDIFLTLSSVAAILSGCAIDDKVSTPADEKHVIEFSNIHVNNSTRNSAPDIPFSQFKVYGFADSPQSYLFEGAGVDHVSDDVWRCSQTEFWYPGHDYWFAALAPADAKGVDYDLSMPDSKNYPGIGKIHYDASETEGKLDLMYAFSGKVSIPSNNSGEIPPVALEFNHLLTEVRFMFYNDLDNSHFFINVPSITIGNMYSQGSVDLSSGRLEWQREGWEVFWTGMGRVDGIKTDKPKMSDPVFLLPIKVDGGKIQLQTQLFFVYNPKDEEGFKVTDVNTFTIDFPAIDFKPGHSYTLIARLNHDNVGGDNSSGITPISFEIEDHSWHYNSGEIEVRSK